MESLKMVRCFLGKSGTGPEHGHDEDHPRSARFIPLNEFELWKYMMEHRHGLEVSEPVVSVWADQEEFERLHHVYRRVSASIRVRKLMFFGYSPDQELDYQAIRFVAEDDCEPVKEIILRHFQGESQHEDLVVEETPGLWLQQ